MEALAEPIRVVVAGDNPLTSAVAAPNAKRTYQLLIVEDDDILRPLYTHHIRQQAAGACTIQQAADGAAGLAALKARRFDCVLLDFRLPDMNGLQFLTEVTTEGALPCSFVVVTGAGNEAIAVEAMKRGAHDYLVKDQMDLSGLWRLIERAIAQTELRQQLAETARDLKQRSDELARSNAALDQFAYGASHDMKAPLRAIGNLATWIEEDIAATESASTIENVRLIGRRVRRLQNLVDGMLAYARVGRTDAVLEDVDIAKVVEDVIDMLELPPGFVAICEGEMPIIRGYRAPIQMIFKNLISNGLQHHDRAEGNVVVTMRQAVGAAAEFRVSDDGPGIQVQFHDQVFEIFQTLEDRDGTESSGIGLAMVRKQVTENGGRIWIESAPPVRGTTFVFTLGEGGSGQGSRPH